MTYLTSYRTTVSNNLYKGIGGKLRQRLDQKAHKLGQKDRHSLFLYRIFDLCGTKLNNIADLGCGNGWALSYKEDGINRYGVDMSTEFKEELEKNGIKLVVADLSGKPFPFRDQEIDLLIMNHIIEHLPNPDLIAHEIQRVLKPGGYVYIRTPDIKLVGQEFWDDYTHIQPYSRRSLHQLFSGYGFTPIKTLTSNHGLINLDILTNGHFRNLICSKYFGAKEIEAIYQKLK